MAHWFPRYWSNKSTNTNIATVLLVTVCVKASHCPMIFSTVFAKFGKALLLTKTKAYSMIYPKAKLAMEVLSPTLIKSAMIIRIMRKMTRLTKRAALMMIKMMKRSESSSGDACRSSS